MSLWTISFLQQKKRSFSYFVVLWKYCNIIACWYSYGNVASCQQQQQNLWDSITFLIDEHPWHPSLMHFGSYNDPKHLVIYKL
jgi:hypothetical protein